MFYNKILISFHICTFDLELSIRGNYIEKYIFIILYQIRVEDLQILKYIDSSNYTFEMKFSILMNNKESIYMKGGVVLSFQDSFCLLIILKST